MNDALRFLLPSVQAHSAKADQNPFVLRTPGILEMCLNAVLNQIANIIKFRKQL
jgi:hypothetical protein